MGHVNLISGVGSLLLVLAANDYMLAAGLKDQSDSANLYRTQLCSTGPEAAQCTAEELALEFLKAVDHGNKDDIARVIDILKDRGFIDTVNGHSTLATAIFRGRSDIVAALLDAGADPLAVDRHGRPFLYQGIASAYSSTPELAPKVVESVRIILKNAAASGRLPSNPPLDASIVFYGGARNPSLDLLKLFITHGAEPNRKGWYWYNGSPLDAAIVKKNLDFVRIMVSPGSRISQSELDAKAFDAAMKRRAELLEVFRSAGADPKRHINANPKILFDAARPEGSIEMLEFLLKSGADPNVREHEKVQRTPIFAAGFDPEKIRLLLRYGADPNAKDSGYTFLAHTLLFAPREISIPPSAGSVEKPRVYDKVSLVTLLLDYGADLNGNNGGLGQWGALGLARRENKEVISLLISRGATLHYAAGKHALLPHLRHKYGKDALGKVPGPVTIAVDILERDDLALAQIARSRKVDSNDDLALLQAVRRGWREVAEALLQAGADPNIADTAGVTPLAMAERRRDEKLSKALLAAGANPSPRPAQRYKIDAGGEFETTVAAEIDDVILLDPPRFYLQWPEEASFAFYGKQIQGRGQSFDQIQCEQSVAFKIVSNAGVAGAISAGVCGQKVERLRELAAGSKQGIDTLLNQLVSGAKADGLDPKQLGWTYERKEGPNGSEIHYFPLIVIGHGILSAPTVVLVSVQRDRAVVVQADVTNLCGEGRNMQRQTPLCSDTKGAVIEIATRLFHTMR